MAAGARGILIAGNWKLNHGLKETEAFFSSLPLVKAGVTEGLKVCLFPPMLSLARAVELSHPFAIEIGAQNAHWAAAGAYTGEVSASMLHEAGARWALVGHSERRQHFGETDAGVGNRTRGLLAQGINVIACIGETRAEREAGKTEGVIAAQLAGAFGGDPAISGSLTEALRSHRLVIAYEPVWAIGTGLVATPEQAQEAHQITRRELARHFGGEASACAQILYGGSVTPENVASLLACPDVDGALVGGASLKAESFAKLVHAGLEATTDS